jgi:O-antigen ligase
VLLASLLPFETIRPLVSTPWLALDDEKLLLLMVVVAWVAMGKAAVPDQRERILLLPSLALLAISLGSALLAPDNVEESLKSLWRLAAAIFIFLLTLRLAREPRQRRGLLWALAIGAAVSGLLGLGEAANWSPLQPLLGAFKIAPTKVGGEIRVSGSFQYATIAAMYFEMVAPIAIALALSATSRRSQLFALAIAALCAANVVLSLTRAGLLTLTLISMVLLLAALRSDRKRQLLVASGTILVVLVGGIGLQALRNPVFDMRLSTESDADWYGAAYVAPTTLTLQPDSTATVDLDVRNEGRIVWTASGNHRFALGYRWLTADGDGVLDVMPGEVPLPRDVGPGETVHLQTSVVVPDLPAGTYRVDWGMLQRDVLQFYERGWADAETLVHIPTTDANAQLTDGPAVQDRDDGEAPWVVGRLDLWRAGLGLFAARPLLGVGPDNFRHLYGTQLGLDSWDERVQANDVYLEVLVDTGVLGLGAFLLVLAMPLRAALRRWWGNRNNYVILGIILGVVAFLAHGLLDSFLAFTPTMLLFWMLLALLAEVSSAQNPHVSGR